MHDCISKFKKNSIGITYGELTLIDSQYLLRITAQPKWKVG